MEKYINVIGFYNIPEKNKSEKKFAEIINKKY